MRKDFVDGVTPSILVIVVLSGLAIGTESSTLSTLEDKTALFGIVVVSIIYYEGMKEWIRRRYNNGK